MLFRSIISGALTAFTMSIDDFIISYFTAGSSSSTLAMTIYGMTKKRVSPEINAISTLLFVSVLLLLAIINIREAHLEKAALRREALPAAQAAPRWSPPPALVKLGRVAAAAACVVLLSPPGWALSTTPGFRW